jgi:antitoxin CptB
MNDDAFTEVNSTADADWLGMGDAAQALSVRDLSKLRWRCRRGLLENDLFIERFFKRHESGLTLGHARALNVLMDLSDNDLMDLLLCRKEPEAVLGTTNANAAVLDVLKMLKT